MVAQRLARRISLRLLAVYVVAVACLGVLAGEHLWRPSANNHYSHLADAWLRGRLHHDGPPPGYCDLRRRAAGKCRRHTYDDWAVVSTLELADGATVRGFPCRTDACNERKKDARVQTWLLSDGSRREFLRDEIATRTDTWYVSFPPGPALLMLPFVAFAGGPGIWDPLLTVLAAALIPVLLIRFLDRERGTDEGRGNEHLLWASAWTLASPACFLAANGNVWFTAQVVGALCLVAFVDAAWKLRRPMLAGLFLGLAIACRPTMALAGIVFAVTWWRNGRPTLAALRFLGPLLLVGAVLMALNVARFDDPFEFGHRYLDIRWQSRMQEVGMFSTDYLRRNLQCFLWLLPVSDPAFPWFRVSVHGSALWLTTPWVLAAVFARGRGAGPLWLGALGLAIPPLVYQNSGQIQFTYRFAVDWLPLVLLGLALARAGRNRRVLAALVLWGALLQMYGAQRFREPGRLFVLEPPGWPFGDELERDG